MHFANFEQFSQRILHKSNKGQDLLEFIDQYKCNASLQSLYNIWKSGDITSNIPRIEYQQDKILCFTMFTHRQFIHVDDGKYRSGTYELFIRLVSNKNNINSQTLRLYDDALIPLYEAWKAGASSKSSYKNVPLIVAGDFGDFVFTDHRNLKHYMNTQIHDDGCHYCSICNKIKADSFFQKVSKRYCISCKTKVQTDRYHTLLGLKHQMFESVKSMNKQRKHNPFKTSFPEFSDFLECQGIGMLFDNWKDSGFSKYSVPSVKRIDGNDGYTLSNMMLMTYAENYESSRNDLSNGVGRIGEVYTIPVCCVDPQGNTTYHPSLELAGDFAGVVGTTVGQYIKSNKTTKSGFKFSHADRHI